LDLNLFFTTIKTTKSNCPLPFAENRCERRDETTDSCFLLRERQILSAQPAEDEAGKEQRDVTGGVFMKRVMIIAAAMLMGSNLASAAEAIEGNWKTASGETAAIGPCGSAFCVTVKTGKHAGKQIGKLSGKGNSYSGEITDPANDKTYSGSATVSGSSLSMKGCVLKVLCKSQTWTRL